MQLTKHHGLGNDFLITWSDAVPDDAAALARRLCDRHTGLGADGLIFGVESGTDTTDTRDTTVTSDAGAGGRSDALAFVLFNADGSVAEVSGNGLRCFGQALAMRRDQTQLDVTVDTAAGPRRIRVLGPASGADTPGTAGSGVAVEVEVDMGSWSPGPDLTDRQPSRHLAVTDALTVDMGNPHVVIAVADARSWDMADIGPVIEADFLPTGINVHLVSPAADGLTMNIWERGAGVTQACGSGACAAAVAAHRWGWSTEDRVQVDMPGGAATVTVGETVHLRGPAVWVADIVVPDRSETAHG